MMDTVQKRAQMIVLDLEMNPVPKEAASGLAREVIEIGAVRVLDNAVSGDRFHVYVKPSFSCTVSPYIRRLTGIHNGNIRNACSFEAAVRELSGWIGTDAETVICAWSDSDRRQLEEEAGAKKIVMPENMTVFKDVQRLHHEKMGADITRKQMALSSAAEQFGITMSKRDSHSALYDAEITADILVLLETGRYQKQASVLRRAACDRKGSAGSGFLLGDLCREVFEQMGKQALSI